MFPRPPLKVIRPGTESHKKWKYRSAGQYHKVGITVVQYCVRLGERENPMGLSTSRMSKKLHRNIVYCCRHYWYKSILSTRKSFKCNSCASSNSTIAWPHFQPPKPPSAFCCFLGSANSNPSEFLPYLCQQNTPLIQMPYMNGKWWSIRWPIC